MGTLSGWVSPHDAALSVRLQDGLRFLRPPLYPLCRPPSLRSGYRRSGAHRAYPVDNRGGASQFGWDLSPGGDCGCRRRQHPTDGPPHGAVWLRRDSLFRRFTITGGTVLHSRSTLWPSLRRTRVEAGRIWRLSPGFGRRVTPSPARVGTPGHHRACSIFAWQYSSGGPSVGNALYAASPSWSHDANR